MTTSTADPAGARDHARAMAGTRVEAMPTLPAAADDAPAGVVWEETIAPGGYAARRLARGTRLRLVDVAGDACAAMLLFNADMPTERQGSRLEVRGRGRWQHHVGAHGGQTRRRAHA